MPSATELTLGQEFSYVEKNIFFLILKILNPSKLQNYEK